jgi:OMF family outer membrane factor
MHNASFAQTYSLQQCIDSALINNKKIEIVKNQLRSSEIKTSEAKANLIPKLVVNGEYKYYTDLPYQLMPLSVFGGPDGHFKEAQFGVPHNINANVQLTVPIYNAQIYGAIKATKIASQLTGIEQAKTEEQVYYDVSNLYYNAQIVMNQQEFIDSNISQGEILLKNITLLQKELLARKTDIDRVQLNISQLKSKQFTLSNQFIQIMNALKFQMGLSLNDPLSIEKDVRETENKEYQLNESLDHLKIKTYNLLLNSQLKSLQQSRLPSVALFGSYGVLGYGYDQKPNNFLNFYPIGLAGIKVNYPLFNGTVTSKKIDQKRIELSTNELQLELVNDRTNMEIENARMDLSVAKINMETAQSQTDLAQSIYDNTELQRQQGVSSLNDVLAADNERRTAQQNYISALVRYLKADLAIKKLTGNTLK